jgi:hypothetical protein
VQGLASPAAVDPASLTGLLTALRYYLTAADIPIATASVTASTTSAILFSDLALAGLAGRAVGSAAHSGRPAGRISACGSLAVSSRNHRSRLAAVWPTNGS